MGGFHRPDFGRPSNEQTQIIIARIAMPRITKTSWTPSQIARLKELADAGASAVRIAGALNRPINGIMDRARKLGIEIRSIKQIRAKVREAERDAGVTDGSKYNYRGIPGQS